MNLTQRLLAGSLALIAVLVASIVVIAGRRLNDRLANHYTGRDYRNRKNARVSAWIEIDRWHGWGSPNVKR